MLQINPGEIWLTRGGAKVRIYAVDGGEGYPIHGAIDGVDGWGARIWTIEGKYSKDYQSTFDIVRKYDWREGLAPIWAVLKPEFKWMAMDESRTWVAFTETPRHGASVWTEGGRYASLYGLALPTPDCPWYETLTERP